MKKILDRRAIVATACFLTGYYVGRTWDFNINFSAKKNV